MWPELPHLHIHFDRCCGMKLCYDDDDYVDGYDYCTVRKRGGEGKMGMGV